MQRHGPKCSESPYIFPYSFRTLVRIDFRAGVRRSLIISIRLYRQGEEFPVVGDLG
jgi:hypothetical protein